MISNGVSNMRWNSPSPNSLVRTLVLVICSYLSITLHAQTVNLAITGVSPYNSLNITSNFNGQIASIQESWINGSGSGHNYTLKVRSANGGLTHSTQTTSKIPYSLTYAGSGGLTITISTADQQIGSRLVPKTALGSSQTAALSMAYTGTPATNLYQGVYSDTLTFTYTKTGPGGTVTVTRTLNLTATAIGSSLAFTITATAAASNLPLTTSQTNLQVATASETSNTTTGYLVKVRSQNGGYISIVPSSPRADEKIDFTLQYAGEAAALSPANTDSIVKTVAAGLYNNSTSAVTISYLAATNGSAGTYTDNLIFTIEAQ